MKLYIVRHGVTEGNINDIHQTDDTPLTKAGILQARQVANRLKGRGIEVIYTSPHVRTFTTSQIISKALGLPITIWDQLIEIRKPKEIRGKPIGSFEVAKIEKTLHKSFQSKSKKISDEENFFDVRKRAALVLNKLVKEHRQQTVLMVSHGTFIKTLVATMFFGKSLTPKMFLQIRRSLYVENTGITIAQHNPKKGFRLFSWNDTNHL